MTDMNSDGADLRVDQLIDQVLSRRRAGSAGEDLPLGWLSPQEALVTELARLDEIDWPSDETGDRIAARVAATTTAPAANPGLVRRARRPVRPRPKSWLAAGAAAAVALAVASIVQFAGEPHQLAGGPRPVRTVPQSLGRATSPATALPTSPPTTLPTSPPTSPTTRLTAMRIINGGAPNAIGVVTRNDNYLTCVSRSVCYTIGDDGDVARSLDGGAHWTADDKLPGSGDSDPDLGAVSCPHPLTCFLAWGPDVVETNDGFDHFKVLHVITSDRSNSGVSAVSCPSVRHCVATISHANDDQSFVYSDDGGASWTAAASAPVLNDDDDVVGLRCDPDGACMAAIMVAADVGAVTSADGGRTWSRLVTAELLNMVQYTVSCANGRNCVIGSTSGYLAWMHTSASGRTTVRVQTLPISWGQELISLSCVASTCFVVSGDQLNETHDQGRTWTSTFSTTPTIKEDIVSFLSCPVTAGCIGLATDDKGDSPTWAVVSNLPPIG